MEQKVLNVVYRQMFLHQIPLFVVQVQFESGLGGGYRLVLHREPLVVIHEPVLDILGVIILDNGDGGDHAEKKTHNGCFKTIVKRYKGNTAAMDRTLW